MPNRMQLFTSWILQIVTELTNQKKLLVKHHKQQVIFFLYINTTFCVDKMIANENLQGIPLLVLANKQDIPDCMGVREVKPIFNKNSHLIGKRDCMVMPVSALTG